MTISYNTRLIYSIAKHSVIRLSLKSALVEPCEAWHCHATRSNLVTVYQDVSSWSSPKGAEECQSKFPLLSWHLLGHIPLTVSLSCLKTQRGKLCRSIFLSLCSHWTIVTFHYPLLRCTLHLGFEMMDSFLISSDLLSGWIGLPLWHGSGT